MAARALPHLDLANLPPLSPTDSPLQSPRDALIVGLLEATSPINSETRQLAIELLTRIDPGLSQAHYKAAEALRELLG